MSDVLVYVLLALGIAVALDLWLMRRARRYWEKRGTSTRAGQPEVRLFGQFSPVLTWLKYRGPFRSSSANEPASAKQTEAAPVLVPPQPEQEPAVPTAPASAQVARIPSPPETALETPTAVPFSEPPVLEIEFKVRIRWPRSLRRLGEQVRAGRGSMWAARDMERATWVLGAVGLAALGQVLIVSRQFALGIVAYLAAAAWLLLWMRRHPQSRDGLIHIGTLSRRAEILALILLIALAAFARYYRLDQRIYGVDGDEKSWTIQSYFSVIRGEHRGDFADRHFHYLPVTFYLQGWAMQLFGINLLTPRYVNATMSLGALLLFYLIMRRAAGPPAALTSTLLAGFAFIELSASRQAVHDTLVEFWVLLAYFILIEAVQARDARWFLAAGIATAVGMLTYETFFLTPVVALGYLMVCALRDRQNWKEWLTFSIAFLAPLLFVMPSTIEYIHTRQGYHLSSLRRGAEIWAFVTGHLIESLSTLFYAVKFPDQLVRWGGGPIYNIWLLPFFVIGLGYSLMMWRKSHLVLLVLWFVLQFFPFAVLGAPLPRVYYPAMMAASGLAGVGLIAALKACRQLLPGLGPRTSFAAFALVLLGLVLYDVNVFSTRLDDPAEQQKRRELADLVRASTSTAPITYLPYVPTLGDVIDLEQNLIEFSVAGVRGLSRPTAYYTLIELGNLLGRIWDDRALYSTANIIVDKTTFNDPNRQKRNALLSALRWCYPRTQIQPGQFFDVYRLSAEDLQQPTCHSTNALLALQPERGTDLISDRPMTFEWRLNPPPQAFQLVVERRNPKLIWLEAESLFSQDQGWFREARYAADFSGSAYLADNWRAGAAVAQVNITQPAKYRLWVRTYRRAIDDQQTFIAMDAAAPIEIATAQTPLNAWVWQPVDDYELDVGRHTVTLSRTYGTSPHRSIFIDAVVLSADPTFDPGSHTPWILALDTGQQPFATSFTLSGGLPPGRYRWRVQVYDGDRLVNSLGQRGIGTDPQEFNVTTGGSPLG